MVLTENILHERLKTASLSETGGYYRLAFNAMGTECQVSFTCISMARAREFREHVLKWLAGFEARFSRFLPDSLISRINDAAGVAAVEVDEEAESLFKLCDWFHWFTGGIFDPSSLPLMRLWDYHKVHDRAPADDQVKEARERVGWTRVDRKDGKVFLPQAGMGIDLGGIGKEYAVDRVFEMGIDFGLRDIIVDFGHDLRMRGEPPEKGAWRIGLQDPRDPGKCWTGVGVTDRAVCTSGNYFRHFEINGRRYGHILDPRTGYPVDNGCFSSTAIAPTCTAAGILSTTSFILGPELGIKLIDTYHMGEGCLVTNGGNFFSKGFHAYEL